MTALDVVMTVVSAVVSIVGFAGLVVGVLVGS